MTDTPIAHFKGRPIFDNTPTVVCLLVPRASAPRQLLTVVRGNQPGYGKLGLPGGYHMHGETWQAAGRREVYEETGYLLTPSTIRLVTMDTDEYRNNLVIAKVSPPLVRDAAWVQPDETLEVRWLTEVGAPEDWAFPRHYAAAQAFFLGYPSHRMDEGL